MKNLKFYFSILIIIFLSFENIYAIKRIINLSIEDSKQMLPASVKSKSDYSDDGTIITWYDEKNNGSLYVQKLDIGGDTKWTAGGVMLDMNLGSSFISEDDYPQIFSDNNGGAVIIYTKSFFNNKEIYARKVFWDGSTLNRPVCLSSKFYGYNFSPSAVIAGKKNIAVTWENFSGGDFNIHAQLIDLNCNLIWNHGNEVEVCDFPYDQRKPTIACDNDLNIYVAWLDSRDLDEGEFAYNLYANVISKNGNYLEFGSKGKLIFGDDLKNKSYIRKESGKQFENIEKELLANHNLISSDGNSIIASIERSNYEDDGYICVFKLDEKLNTIWKKLIDDFYYQTNPLIVSDNNSGVNVFWIDRRNGSSEIYLMSINKDGYTLKGGRNGEVISCDNMKITGARILPSEKNQNGICLYQNKIFLSWVNTLSDKLNIQKLNLPDESSNCGDVIELLDGVSEGEYTSITNQDDNLVVVYKHANSIFALIKEIKDNNKVEINRETVINNFPNPFNPSTKISFLIPSDGFVRLSVFDITGKEIKSLINEFKLSGKYNITFDGSNLSSGIYFYTLETNGLIQTKKMTLVK